LKSVVGDLKFFKIFVTTKIDRKKLVNKKRLAANREQLKGLGCLQEVSRERLTCPKRT
jgi:hypothetical protein